MISAQDYFAIFQNIQRLGNIYKTIHFIHRVKLYGKRVVEVIFY